MYDDGLSRLISDHGARTLYLAVFNSAVDLLVVLHMADVDVEQLATIHIFNANLSFLVAYLTRNVGRPPEFPPEHSEHADESQD